MTKEELKKEAEESAKKFFGKPTDLVDLDNLRIFKNGYLASAEPREKRITELETQIEKMKELLEKWYNQYSDKTYTETFYQDLLRATEKYLWTDVEA